MMANAIYSTTALRVSERQNVTMTSVHASLTSKHQYDFIMLCVCVCLSLDEGVTSLDDEELDVRVDPLGKSVLRRLFSALLYHHSHQVALKKKNIHTKIN